MHDSLAPIRPESSRRCALSVVFALIVLGLGVSPVGAQPAAAAANGQPHPSSTMQSFVIIFRQGPRELTEAEKVQRQQEVSAWAREQIAADHLLEPRILSAEILHPQDQGPAAAGELDGPPLTALLFIAARDLAHAGRIAASHPGRKYGARVEVRPWSYPPGYGAMQSRVER